MGEILKVLAPAGAASAPQPQTHTRLANPAWRSIDAMLKGHHGDEADPIDENFFIEMSECRLTANRRRASVTKSL